MTLQNTTVEDSEEYKELQDLYLYDVTRKINKLKEANKLLKQFHYGPVNETYKKQVKDYIDKEGL